MVPYSVEIKLILKVNLYGNHVTNTSLSACIEQGVQRMDKVFDGIVRSGLGTGASYVLLPHFFDYFISFFGAAPFPGTLNIQLSMESIQRFRTAIEEISPLVIPARNVDGYDLWRVLCYWIYLWKVDRGGEHDGERCLALEFDNLMHPQDVVEVVSPVHFRKRFGLLDGDTIHFMLDINRKRFTKTHSRYFETK
jgi:CTP-dependent riboflavin kinase